jgi:hypothetical protein
VYAGQKTIPSKSECDSNVGQHGLSIQEKKKQKKGGGRLECRNRLCEHWIILGSFYGTGHICLVLLAKKNLEKKFLTRAGAGRVRSPCCCVVGRWVFLESGEK